MKERNPRARMAAVHTAPMMMSKRRRKKVRKLGGGGESESEINKQNGERG